MSTVSVSQAKGSNLIGRVRGLSSSTKVWLGVLVFLLFVKLVLMSLLPNAFADPAQAALFDWMPLAIFAVLGSIGVLLSERTGFAEAWGPRGTNRRRLLAALGVGVSFGVVMATLDILTHFAALLASNHGLTQQYTGLVPMLFAFSGGSILVEIVYRIFPIPLLLWLISNVALRGRGQSQVFWLLAILLSALEPLGQISDLAVLPGPVMIADASIQYAENFMEVTFFRKYGFLSAILVRFGFYLIWHVLYVH